MRRSAARVVAVGVLIGLAGWPAVGRAGVWVTLASGLPGSATPTSDSEFWFDTGHGPPLVALNSLAGGTTAQATTAGGTVFFGGDATPVLLNLADGSAYIANGNPPAAATTAGPNGTGTGTPASAAPVAGGTVPSTANLLGLTLALPDATGARGLTAIATDPNGNPLGTDSVIVPSGGWWVLGLTPGDNTTSTGSTSSGSTSNPNTGGTLPPPVGGGGDGGTPPPPPPPPPPSGGTVATPEPSTFVLVGIGGVAAGGWRRARGRLRLG